MDEQANNASITMEIWDNGNNTIKGDGTCRWFGHLADLSPLDALDESRMFTIHAEKGYIPQLLKAGGSHILINSSQIRAILLPRLFHQHERRYSHNAKG